MVHYKTQAFSLFCHDQAAGATFVVRAAPPVLQMLGHLGLIAANSTKSSPGSKKWQLTESRAAARWTA